MAEESDNFFATQIAQKGEQQKEQETQHKVIEESPKKEQNPEKKEGHDNSLRNLLTAFNQFDKIQKGVISLDEAQQILKSRDIPIDKFELHFRMSLPIQNNSITFDEFLFVFGLCENTSVDIEDKYHLCKKVDQRLIQFLRLLNNYRKKSEHQHNYKQAKKSKSKIQEMRQRELERRKNYLNILHDHQISELEEKQRVHFMDFCNTWDQFMMDYEKTAADLIQKLQSKHQAQIVEFAEKTREELASKMHYSKHILELSTKQRNLVKLQEYEKANSIHEEIERMKRKQEFKKQKSDEQVIEIRCTGLKKQQVTAVNNLLQNIQKDRNDQMKQRKTDSQKLIVRNRSLVTQINHKHTQAIKRVFEALHNISLQNDRIKR